MQVVSVSQLRSNLKKYLDNVAQSLDILIVPRATKNSAVVIISLKEYNALKETAQSISTNANRLSIQQSINQLKAGETQKFEMD